MTIRLLAAYPPYPINAIVTLDAGTEAGLVAAKLADTNLSGGAPYNTPAKPGFAVSAHAHLNGFGNPSGGLVTIDGHPVNLVSNRVAGALRMIGNNGTANMGTNGGNGKIIDAQHPALSDFVGVKLVYANYDTTAPMQINKAKVAASARHSTPGGNALAWSAQVTFNGALTAQVPQAIAGVGGNAAAVIPGVLVSDLVAVSSIPRTDGGAGRLLRVRTHFNDNTYPLNMSNAPTAGSTVMALYNANSNSLQYASSAFNGIPSDIETSGYYADVQGGPFEPVAVIFYYAKPVKTIGVFGDSIFQGVGSTSSLLGWPERLTANSFATANTLISAANFGVSGQKHEDSHATMKSVLTGYKPQYVAFKAWSPNNVSAARPTQAIMDDCWARTLEAIELCHQNNIVPIVFTSLPVNGYVQSDKNLILAQNARVMALPGSVIKVDMATALSLNGNINPLYDTDGTHPNDAGHSFVADLVQTVI